MADLTEQKVSSEVVFTGRVITVTHDTITQRDGKPATRDVVHHSGGAAIVALNEKGEVALIRQYRYAVRRTLIELPAGKVEVGEAPRATAIRELEEEAGLVAKRFEEFGSIIPTCGYCTEVIYLFLATGLSTVPQHFDEGEFVELFWMPLDEAVQMVLNGGINDGKTVAGLLRAKLLVDTGKIKL